MRKNTYRKWHAPALAGAAAVLIAGAALSPAWSYFTDYVTAAGGYTIRLGDETTIEEDFSNWTKHLVITADEDTQQPVFVRARAYSGNIYSLSYSDAGGRWNPDADGWYYYSEPIGANESTDELDVVISGVPADVTYAASFNVAVVYESTPVLYDEDGEAYADWDAAVDSGSVKEGQ